MSYGTDELLAAIFVGFESAFAYSAMLPSIMTINTFVDSPQKILAIRHGEVLATGFAAAWTVFVAMAIKSLLPIVFSGFAVVMMLIIYEWALRNSPGYMEWET